VTSTKGVDSIIEWNLANDLDFGDLDSLTAIIEGKTAEFIEDVERFLSDHGTQSRG
jgi:hypothetical protein